MNKKVLTPCEKRELVAYSRQSHGMSIRKACEVFTVNSSVLYYKKRSNNEDHKMSEELLLLANQHQTWGFWLIRHRLKNLGFEWNHKQIYLIYTSMN